MSIVIEQVETSRWYVDEDELAELVAYWGEEYPELSTDMQPDALLAFLDDQFDRGSDVAYWIQENWINRTDAYEAHTTITHEGA
ncbi:hypothetical protein SEA_DATBOI_153 [Gordonia phage DatBoi]|nr:hypothetical protein SEA_DATBOI_153 [Gordonia phage DatBoi]